MGSYFGHVIWSVYLVVSAIWWMLNAYSAYIKSLWQGDEYRSESGYPWPGKPHIPLETICKLILSLAGFVGELCVGGVNFIDEEGHFINLDRIQHVSVYSVFVVHSCVELAWHMGAPLPRGLDRLSLALAFTWAGLCFTFHAGLERSYTPVEHAVHELPAYMMFLVAVTLVVEIIRPYWFLAQLVRIFGTLVVGTWTCFTITVLYKPSAFPGDDENPSWDRSDARNASFLTAALGFHLAINMAVVCIVYLVVVCFLKARGHHMYQFRKMTSNIRTKKSSA